MAHPNSSSTYPGGTGTGGRTVPQLLALVIGVVFLLVGVAGFFVTGFEGWTEHDHDQTVLGFAVNPLHNVVHIVIGALGIALARTASGARTYGWLLFVVYTLTFIYGLVVLGNPEANILNINGADNGLHIVSALAGLVVALWPRHRDGARTTRTR